ncbi:MAG: GAP family protein [Mycobacterium sp.]
MDKVLAMALIAATNPVRLGIALLLISRSRPMVNLLAYWLGAMATGITAALGLLIVVHGFAPTFMQSVSALGASSAARHTQIAIGLLALLVAALIAVGFSVRRMRVPMAGGDPSARVLRPSPPSAFARLLGRAQDVLKGESLWVAFGAGLGSGFPPVEYPVALAVIAASGGAIGTQISAAIIFSVVMLAVVEIPLVSYSATPAQTQAVMLRLHDWVRPRRWRILAIIVAGEAALMVATGLG